VLFPLVLFYDCIWVPSVRSHDETAENKSRLC
jgi:hypothetical protein